MAAATKPINVAEARALYFDPTSKLWQKAETRDLDYTVEKWHGEDMPTLPCVEWTGAADSAGYGRVTVAGETFSTHRVALTAFTGRQLDEAVDHLCERPACFEVAHLEDVTQAVNLARSTTTITARNRARSRCPYGHALVAPNLVLAHARRGQRSCLACNRAQARAQGALVRAGAAIAGLTPSEFRKAFGSGRHAVAPILGTPLTDYIEATVRERAFTEPDSLFIVAVANRVLEVTADPMDALDTLPEGVFA